MKKVKDVLIVFNDKKKHIKKIVGDLMNVLEERNISYFIVPPAHLELKNHEIITDFDDRYKHKDYQLIFAIGGDGTFLYTARTFHPFKIPLVGINAGRLGFLMEIKPSHIKDAIDRILNDHVEFIERMILDIRVTRNGKDICQFSALNEVVISRGAFSRMVDIDVNIDKIHFSKYRADGVIVSTPTGSTAYNLSAGGPILTPKTEAFIITPICPHTLGVRPIIIHSDKVLEFEVVTPELESDLTIDGQEKTGVCVGDKITIKKSENSVVMYYFGDYNFYNTLREKLGWQKC